MTVHGRRRDSQRIRASIGTSSICNAFCAKPSAITSFRFLKERNKR